MGIFKPGKLKSFASQRDGNQIFQEISTILISIGLGLYFYEQRSVLDLSTFLGRGGNSLWPASWTTEGSRPYLIAAGVLIGLCLLGKILIYLSLWDVNVLCGARARTGRGIDVNGIGQEIATALMGIAIGWFSAPVSKNLVLFEKSEFPNPLPGIAIATLCLLTKIFLYAQVLDFNGWLKAHHRTPLWQWAKLRPFLAQYDWNRAVQELTSIAIGIGMGLYLYESRIIFLPAQWVGAILGQGVEKDTYWILEKTVGKVQRKLNVEIIPDFWSNKDTRPYLVVGIALVLVSLLFKITIYLSLFNANGLRNRLLGSSRRGPPAPFGVDYNGIADEVLTLLISIAVGLVTMPVVQQAFWQEQAPYPYHEWGFLLLGVLILLKMGLIAGLVDFRAMTAGKPAGINRSPKNRR